MPHLSAGPKEETAMKTRAAVALEKGKPLEITEVELGGTEGRGGAGRGEGDGHLPYR